MYVKKVELDEQTERELRDSLSRYYKHARGNRDDEMNFVKSASREELVVAVLRQGLASMHADTLSAQMKSRRKSSASRG